MTCEKRCRLLRTLVNLRCPGCFGAEVGADKEGRCDCKLTMNPDRLLLRWE